MMAMVTVIANAISAIVTLAMLINGSHDGAPITILTIVTVAMLAVTMMTAAMAIILWQ